MRWLTYIWAFGFVVIWARGWWLTETDHRAQPVDGIPEPWWATLLRGAFCCAVGASWPLWLPLLIWDEIRA